MDDKCLLEDLVQPMVDVIAWFGLAPGESVSLSAGQQQQHILVEFT
ncbi:hypothetical protein PSEUDO8BK_190027 [Pseudomonas sp. 8BK]|nr:hypothetical protein PSEUDO8BK_190027 [Pseudomonas sp. 8BK]